ncbi:hypothetical protein LINPERHAP1_LOCUS16077, partial [Linum perenne]
PQLLIPGRITVIASYPNPPTLVTTSNSLSIKVNLSPIHGIKQTVRYHHTIHHINKHTTTNNNHKYSTINHIIKIPFYSLSISCNAL